MQSLTQTAGAGHLNSKTFECLIIQKMKKDVNHASVQFSLSQSGTRIACQSKRTNTQTSLWQSHTHPSKAKWAGGDQWVPSTTNNRILTPVSSWAVTYLGKGYLGTWNFADWLRDLTGNYMHMLTFNFSEAFYNLYVGFLNKVTDCTHKWGCITISYIYIR